MGREIRRVPPNWQHPQKMYSSGLGYAPMLDQTFAAATTEWDEGKTSWDSGNDPDREKHKNDDGSYITYADWHGERPDDPSYYRPWADSDATWYQLWETVSEGTPVSPPFATLDELADHLAQHGDDWDQQRGHGGWGRKAAEAFCKSGWAPSMMIVGRTVYNSKDIPLALEKDKGA